jgi:hypothetical protein
MVYANLLLRTPVHGRLTNQIIGSFAIRPDRLTRLTITRILTLLLRG